MTYNFLLVSCLKDQASINFKDRLLEKYKFKEIKKDLFEILIDSKNKIYIKIINQMHIFIEQKELIKDIEFKIDYIIFLSKHSTLGKNKPKCMTVHAIGNWGKAELGGKNNTVIKTDPILIRLILFNLKKNKPKEIKPFEVKQEATHHGPFLEYCTFFYEIGSDQESWENKQVSEFMIGNLIETIKDYDKKEIKQKRNWKEAIGIGGSHYCSKFNKKTFKESFEFAIGHVVASYALKEIKEKPELLEQAKQKSNSLKEIYDKDL